VYVSQNTYAPVCVGGGVFGVCMCALSWQRSYVVNAQKKNENFYVLRAH
jgi:hypothetical protein